MSQEVSFSYLANPQKYCDTVSNLIDKGDDKWKNVWKAGVLELFQNPEYSVNSINSLLKVIERAFKERTYTIRAQAFECWQFFITKVELHVASEKLLNVILIPLCASNHSVFIVLQSKLKTWLTLLNTSLITKPILKEKGIQNLLRILYGPHSLPTASSCNELLELCGTIYSILVQKCLPYDETNIILSYLEKAIPSLSRSESTQVMARKIWTFVLDRISFNKWPSTQFGYLMKTFENLLSDNNEHSNALASELLSYLICEYNSIPVDCLMPHLNLITRCLFHSSVNDLSLTNTMEAILKKFKKKENFFFDEMEKTLTEFSEDYKNKLQKCWITVVFCFCKWMKENPNSVYENCEWILLFPVKHLHDKWNAEITEQMQQCYEIISVSVGNDSFLCNLCRKLVIILNNSENVPVSLLNGATCLCKIILQKCKPSDEVSSIRHVLITIFQKMPSQVSTDDIQKTFFPKYLSCVLYFVECYPDYGQDFSAIIRKYSQCIDVENEGKELPVVQLISKYNNMQNENSENNPSVLKVCNGVNMLTGDKITPAKSKIRSSFLSRLSPVEKKPVLTESPSAARSIRTPKSSQKSKLSDDDDVQFITVLPKPKNSPMTEHQKEMAKAKSYIPALYEDLSQSQSQSDSLSSFSSRKDQPVVNVSSDYFEENANLPSINNATDSAEEVPSSFNFHKTIKSGKLTKTFSSKKSLFNDLDSANQHLSYNLSNNLEKNENNLNTEDFSTENHDISFSSSTNDKELSTTRAKRKSSRIEYKTPELEPLKRSKVSLSAVSSDSKSSNRKKGRPRKSISEKKEESPTKNDTEVINMIDSESQNLFVTKTPTREVNRNITASSPATSLLTVKNSSTVDKNTRRRSLRSKNTNNLTRQSPVATRKRKSLSTDTAESKKNMYVKCDEMKINSDLNQQNLLEGTNSVNKVEVEVRTTEDIQSCQTTEKHSENKESSFPSSNVVVLHSGTKITADSEKVSSPNNTVSCCEKNLSTSFATVNSNSEEKIPYNSDEISLKNTDLITETDVRESPLISDSVIIIEDEKEYDVIIINDSQSQSEPNVKQADIHEICSLNETENAEVQTDIKIDVKVKNPEDESTFFENTQITSGSKENHKQVTETVLSEANESSLSADVFGVSESRCENSFKLNLSQVDNTNENKIDVSANEVVDLKPAENSNRFENSSITENNDGNSALKVRLIVEEQTDNLASTTTPYENKTVSTAIEESSEKDSVLPTENIVVTVSKSTTESDQEKSEDKSREVPSTDASSAVIDKSVGGSPISNNTRTSQMLKMVFGAQVVTNQRGRGKIQSNRNSLGGINSTCSNNSVVSSRITTNSRTMKMLQVNGHKESPVRPSPNKKTAVSTEKIERLTYVPKDCTSPGILKKPNLNSTLSPRSPKSVNFAEILTDTREYQIDDDNNFSDSWTSFDNEFSNNLLSDEEGTSQETLYLPLHNCSDDIKYLVERLSLNQKQLDTFRRMGIETVGQLASASTIIGKSIPVGDNRLNRLRNALKAYDNDRKLKGLRAPSVRRKIVYKSQNKQLEVGSIIEILDDVDEFDPEIPAPESESMEKIPQICQPTVKIIKVEDDETCTYVLSKNLSFTSGNSSSVSLALTEEKSSGSKIVELSNISKSLVESKDEVEKEKEIINTKVADIEPSGNIESSTLSKIQFSPVRVQVERVSLPYSPSTLQSSPSKKQQSPSKGQQFHLTEKQSSSPKRKLFPDEEELSPTKRPKEEEEETCKEPRSFIEDLPVSSATDVPLMMEMNTITESSDHIVDNVDIAQSVVEEDKNDVSVIPNEDNVECKSSTPELEGKEANIIDLELKMDYNSVKSTATDKVNVEFITDTKMNIELKSSDDKSTESTDDNDVNEDVDFICTNNDDFICKNDNLRTYSRLVKARLSMALLHSEDNVTSEIKGPTSPEIIRVEVVNSRISEPVDTQEKSISNFSEKKDNSIIEEHSMSIFSPDMTKDNINLALDSTSQSLIDVSRCISESQSIKRNVEIQKTGNNNVNDDVIHINDDEASKQEEMITLSQWDGQRDVSTSKNSQRNNLFQRLVYRTLEPYIGPAGARRYTVTEDEAEELFKEMVDGLCVELEDFPIVQLKETTKTRLKNILNSLSSSINS